MLAACVVWFVYVYAVCQCWFVSYVCVWMVPLCGLYQLLDEHDPSLGMAIVEAVPQGKCLEVLRAVQYFYHVKYVTAITNPVAGEVTQCSLWSTCVECVLRCLGRMAAGSCDVSLMSSLLAFAQQPEDKNLQLVKWMMSDQLQKELEKGSGNLFRADSVATKSANVYLRMIGLPYLYETVGR